MGKIKIFINLKYNLKVFLIKYIEIVMIDN